MVVATKFPSYVVRHRGEARLARAPVPAGVRARRDGARPVRAARRRTGRCGGRCRSSTASRSARRRGSSRRRRTSPGGSSARPGSSPRCCRTRRRRFRTGRPRREGFVLSASRLDRAKRIDLLLEGAALRSGFDVVIVSDGPDRDRLEGIARDEGPRRPRPFRGARRARSGSPSSTRRARPSSTRPSTRTSGWGRTRRSSPASR